MMFAFIRRLVVPAALGVLAITAGAARPAAAAEPVMIFAAATFKDALDAVAAAAENTLHVKVTTVYGSSPGLVKQLENGAPADIFFSADDDWMKDAIDRHLVDPATRVDLLSSTLVLIAPAPQAATRSVTPDFPLMTMLGTGRLAMCDPSMMPAGRYGRIALQRLGLWDGVRNHVANAENVRVAVADVARQEAPLGIVFDTDARLDKRVAIIGIFPPDTHPPIVFPVAAVAHGHNPDTPRVLAFLASANARPIFEKYGYAVLPPGSSR